MKRYDLTINIINLLKLNKNMLHISEITKFFISQHSQPVISRSVTNLVKSGILMRNGSFVSIVDVTATLKKEVKNEQQQ